MNQSGIFIFYSPGASETNGTFKFKFKFCPTSVYAKDKRVSLNKQAIKVNVQLTRVQFRFYMFAFQLYL